MIVWYGTAVRDAIRAKCAENIKAAADKLHAEQVAMISTPGPGLPRSLPGEPPHIDTSELIASGSVDSASDRDHVAARVGWESEHAWRTELGDGNAAPRPWAVRTLVEQQDPLAKIACDP